MIVQLRVMMVLGVGMVWVGGQNVLEPLVVTASRLEGGVGGEPYAVAYLDGGYLREQGRRTLPEALQYTPGVLVQKTAHGHGSPFIRGFTGRQNLLLMDGVRLNNSTFRSGPVQYWNTVDSWSLDHLELVKSQGSVLYGSDAIGGTLNAFGKAAGFREREAGKVYGGGAAMYEYRSNGEGSNQGRVEAEAGVGGRGGILLGGTWKDFGDIESDAVGLMRGTGYVEEDTDVRIDYAVTSDAVLTLAAYFVNQDDVSRWHRTVANPGWVDGGHVAVPGKWRVNRFDQERSLAYLRYAGEDPSKGAWVDRWSATLSWQASEDSEFQNRLPDPAAGSRPLRGSSVHVETVGFDLELESGAGAGVWVYGVDHYRDRVDSEGYQSNVAGTNRRESLPLADDSEYQLTGVFGQYVWEVEELLEVTGGARYTHADAELGRYTDAGGVTRAGGGRDWDAVVGSLRAIQRVGAGWSVYGGVSQSFRAPNLDDLSGNMAARAGGDALGNVGLDPERYVTGELGVRLQSATVSWGLAGFYTDAEDMIVGVPVAAGSGTTVAVNASEGYVYGFEMDGEWRFHPQWALSGFVAWQDGRNQSPRWVGGPVEDKPNTRQLPLSGSVALRWTAEGGKVWVEGRLIAADLEDRITAADQAADNQRIPTGGTPGYVAASLRAGWTVSDALELTGGLENLGDADYRVHGSGQNEPGFGAVLAARVKW